MIINALQNSTQRKST